MIDLCLAASSSSNSRSSLVIPLKSFNFSLVAAIIITTDTKNAAIKNIRNNERFVRKLK